MSFLKYELEDAKIGFLNDKWQGAWALMRDVLTMCAGQAVGASFIASKDCDIDALLLHGDACEIRKGYFESEDKYQQRLLDRWENKKWVGTRKGMVDQLSWAIAGAMGIERSEVNISIKENWEWTARLDRPDVQDHDHRPFWVIVRQPHPFGTSGPHWGDGSHWGTPPLDPDSIYWGAPNDGGDNRAKIVDLIKTIAREQCPAHARIVEIIVVISGDVDETTGADLPGSSIARWRMS